jgi:hypothetical protein
MTTQSPSCSSKLKDDFGAAQTASFCASDFSSFSSADLSSMIASWVDRNSCGEYEKELKVSSGMNFKAIAMRQHASEKNSTEKCRRSSVGCTPYQSNQDTATDGVATDQDTATDLPSPKRRCTYNTMDGQNFLRYDSLTL